MKPFPPAAITASLTREGLPARASRRRRTRRSCSSVSVRCSSKIFEISGSPAMSGAVRSWASACSSMEWASVRYFVSWVSMSSAMHGPSPTGDLRKQAARLLDQTFLERLGDELRTRARPELAHRVADVGPDRLERQPELVRDVASGQALRHQAHDLLLAGRERVGPDRGRLGGLERGPYLRGEVEHEPAFAHDAPAGPVLDRDPPAVGAE